MKDLFEKRPSKEEDMELIFKLREEIMTKEKLLRAADENMEYYRNELLNREELYNKYFGTNNPKVGFINPIKNKENTTNNQNGNIGQKVRIYNIRFKFILLNKFFINIFIKLKKEKYK